MCTPKVRLFWKGYNKLDTKLREIVERFIMARRKSDTPQKAAMREMMQGYLKENDISIKSGNDVNSIMRDMMSVLLEGVLVEASGDLFVHYIGPS